MFKSYNDFTKRDGMYKKSYVNENIASLQKYVGKENYVERFLEDLKDDLYTSIFTTFSVMRVRLAQLPVLNNSLITIHISNLSVECREQGQPYDVVVDIQFHFENDIEQGYDDLLKDAFEMASIQMYMLKNIKFKDNVLSFQFITT